MSTEGQKLVNDAGKMVPLFYLFSMQNQQTAADQGAWVKMEDVKAGSFEFLNDGGLPNNGNDSQAVGAGTLTSFTAEIMLSNSLNPPANNIDGTVLATVSSVGFYTLSTLARWCKVKVSAISVTGGASLGVRFHART